MVAKQQYDFMIRLIMVGDSEVGKTSLITRFTDEVFKAEHIATIGIDFRVKTLVIDGKNVKLQIWDTAGQERFRTITQSYYKGAQGVVLCYDCTNEKSFENVMHWAG